MELAEAIRRRRMCRNFSPDPVPPEVVDRLLERARRAPSAGHSQGWSFLVLESPAQVDRFWAASSDPEWLAAPNFPGVLNAPVVVVPLCSPEPYLARYSEPDKIASGHTTADTWPVPYWTVDVSFATMLLLLGAVEEGLGALFFGMTRDAAALRREFAIPEDWEPIGAVALGRPAEEGYGPPGSAVRGRRPVEEVVHRGRW
jgi:nitroreductase